MSEPITLQIGIDWADTKHDYSLLDPKTGEIEKGVVLHDSKTLHLWIGKLRERIVSGRIEICLEMSKGPLIELLCEYDFIDIYPFNPICSKRFRESMYPSLVKDDPTDADLHLEYLRFHKKHLRLMDRGDDQVRLLGSLTQDRREFVGQRTSLVESLIATLKLYYPQVLPMVGKMSEKMSRRFLQKWPDWESLQKAKPQTLRKFYYANGSRSESCISKRLEAHTKGYPFTNNEVTIQVNRMKMLCLVQQLDLVDKQIVNYDQQIKEVYKQREEREIFSSFPGAGIAMAPRLLVAWLMFGKNMIDAVEMAAFSGVAPVKVKSNRSVRIFSRLRKPKFLHQTFVEHAKWSINHCDWAKRYYDHRKDVLKHSYWSIIRSLAFKWIRIMHRCVKDNKPYDDEKYNESLLKRGSWIGVKSNE